MHIAQCIFDHPWSKTWVAVAVIYRLLEFACTDQCDLFFAVVSQTLVLACQLVAHSNPVEWRFRRICHVCCQAPGWVYLADQTGQTANMGVIGLAYMHRIPDKLRHIQIYPKFYSDSRKSMADFCGGIEAAQSIWLVW